jgi:hypothetical protein
MLGRGESMKKEKSKIERPYHLSLEIVYHEESEIFPTINAGYYPESSNKRISHRKDFKLSCQELTTLKTFVDNMMRKQSQ